MAQAKTVTGADVSEPVVTDTSSGEPAEPEVQTPDSDERLAKLEADLLGFVEKVEQEAAARAEAEVKAARAEELRKIAEADRDREVKIRIGHQQNTGPKLQELADLKRRQAEQTALEEKIDRLQGLVTAMASNSLQPEDIDRVNQQIAQSQQTKELERLRTEVQQRSQPAPQQQAPELTPAWKKQLKDEWFAEFDVDPLDLTNEEWHQYDSRDENHWKSQVRAEFEKRHNAKKPKTSTADEIQTLVAAQVEAQVKATREEDAKRFAETKAELEELKKTHEETKRLAEEQLNRSKGMDRGHESVSETVVEKSLAKELAKNSSLLGSGTDADRIEFRKRMDDKNLRDRILEHARQVQAKATK